MFYKTQTDSISSIATFGTHLVFAASEDQSIVEYNLLGKNEDEAIELIMNPENDCRKIYAVNENRLVYEATDSSIGFYDLETGIKIKNQKYEKTVILLGLRKKLLLHWFGFFKRKGFGNRK